MDGRGNGRVEPVWAGLWPEDGDAEYLDYLDARAEEIRGFWHEVKI